MVKTLCFLVFQFLEGRSRFRFGFWCCCAFRFGFRFGLRIGFQIPVSAFMSDALTVPFRVRASVSEPAGAPHPGSIGPGGEGRVVAGGKAWCASKPQNAPQRQHGLPNCKEVEETTTENGNLNGSEIDPGTPNGSTHGTEKASGKRNASEDGRPGEAEDRTETKREQKRKMIDALFPKWALQLYCLIHHFPSSCTLS